MTDKAIKVWTNNLEAVEDAILNGEETDSVLTEYGANEFALDFLIDNGIWPHLLVKPRKRKDNGIDWKKLGGIAVLTELLHVGHLAKADKVIKDAKLMRELGFTFAEIEVAKEKDKGVIHRDTLRNYYKAIPQQQSIKEFYGYVNLIREKRWVRGGTYVADGLEIEVYGHEDYEGIGKVYDDKEKRWKYGYKIVLLMNVEEDRERLMGIAIGPINTDERKLLLQIFKDLEKYVDKVKNIMDVIVLDRGYWGYDFLQETIVKKYGIDYVIIAKKSFMFVKEDLRHMIDSHQIKFQERQLYNRSEKTWETVKVSFVKDLMHGYVNKAQPYQGMVNVVVMKHMEGKEEKEVFYVTNKKVKNPLKIVQLYGSRWTIENQGNRDLSQRWLIRTLAGRTLNAITARICLILKLYNAMKIMEMKHGKEWQENKEAIKAMGERSFIAGHGLIVYSSQHFGIMSPRRYRQLIERRIRTVTTEELKQTVKAAIENHLPRDKVDALLRKMSR